MHIHIHTYIRMISFRFVSFRFGSWGFVSFPVRTGSWRWRYVSFRFRGEKNTVRFGSGSCRSCCFPFLVLSGSVSFRFRCFPFHVVSVLSGSGSFRFVHFPFRFVSVPPFRFVSHVFLSHRIYWDGRERGHSHPQALRMLFCDFRSALTIVFIWLVSYLGDFLPLQIP